MGIRQADLIHPVLIYVAVLDRATSKARRDPDFGTYRTRKQAKYKENEEDLLIFEVEKKVDRNAKMVKMQGGYQRESVLMFVGRTVDFMNEDGSFKVSLNDKIVRMTDISGMTVFDEKKLFISEMSPKGEYDNFGFIQLIAERKDVTVGG